MLLNILIACDKFKGTLSSLEVGQALARGLKQIHPQAEIHVRPASDGGEGLLAALKPFLALQLLPLTVPTPLGHPAPAHLGWEPLRQRVWIESAQALGLHLIPGHDRHPLKLNSRGLGLLVRAALPLRPTEILIGLGSSGTVDGGMGLAQALGWQLLDGTGHPLPLQPASLPELARLLPPKPPLPLPRVTALCDVRNPLLGENGGVRVYSPQKGASTHEVLALELALRHWSHHLAEALHCPAESLENLPGAGAAGGLGLACAALLGAELVSGAERVMAETGLLEELDWADWIITGEGAYDAQSHWGKWPQHVISQARARGKPVLLVTGQPLSASWPQGVVAAADLLSLDKACATSAVRTQHALEALGATLSVL